MIPVCGLLAMLLWWSFDINLTYQRQILQMEDRKQLILLPVRSLLEQKKLFPYPQKLEELEGENLDKAGTED